MNLVIITTSREVYHQYLCAEVAKQHRVVAVLHPTQTGMTWRQRRELARRRIQRYGWTPLLLEQLMRRGLIPVGWDPERDLAEAYRRLCGDAGQQYLERVAPIARDVLDINSPQGVALLKSFKPDVVVCSGGPIYRAPIIEAAGLMLNFHTGISPLFNGASTIYWTFANKQPHLTGGTLMKMSTVVDGGDILAHYLPAVESGDTPGMQFVKTLIGATAMYSRFLSDLRSGRRYHALPQGKAFRTYGVNEWTPFQSLTVARYIEQDICKALARPERIHEYWNLPDRAAAEAGIRKTLMELVYNP